MRQLLLLLALAASVGSTPLLAQRTVIESRGKRYDAANLDSLVAATYALISGPADSQRGRDTAAIRQLFWPTARLAFLRPPGAVAQGRPAVGDLSVDDYLGVVARNSRQSAFYERELGRRTQVWNGLASVWSAYEITDSIGGPVVDRGINSLQLIFGNGRWWVLHIAWNSETPASPLPPPLTQGVQPPQGAEGLLQPLAPVQPSTRQDATPPGNAPHQPSPQGPAPSGAEGLVQPPTPVQPATRTRPGN
jgi:hypothetical protein